MHRMFVRDFMCAGLPVQSELFQFALRAYVRQKYFPLVGMNIKLLDEKNGLMKLRRAIDRAARRVYRMPRVRRRAAA